MRVYVERLDQRDADTSREFPFLHRAAPLRPTPGLRASESSSRSNGCKCILFLLASFREGGGERERYAYFVGGRTIRGIVPLSECSQSSRAPSRGDESSLSVFLCSEEEDDNGFEAFR